MRGETLWTAWREALYGGTQDEVKTTQTKAKPQTVRGCQVLSKLKSKSFKGLAEIPLAAAGLTVSRHTSEAIS